MNSFRIKGWMVALGTLILCLTGIAVTLGSFASMSRSELGKEESKARALGLPLEPSDLKSPVKVQDDQNAALLYKDASAYMLRHSMTTRSALAVANVLERKETPAELQIALAQVEVYKPILSVIERAAKFELCDFHREWEQGLSLIFPEYSQIKSLCRIECVKALAQSRSGRLDDALSTLAAVSRTAVHINSDPIIISRLVRAQTELLALKTLDRIVDEHSKDPQFLKAALVALDALPPVGDLRRDYLGEIVTARMTIRRLPSMKNEDIQQLAPNGVAAWQLRSPWFTDAFEARATKHYREIYRLFEPDQMDWIAVCERQRQLQSKELSDGSLANAYNRELTPIFLQAYACAITPAIHRRLTSIGIHLLLDRLQSGELPETLRAYRALDRDPFTGKTFVYDRSRTGFTLISSNVEMNDSRGLTDQPKGKDLVVAFKL
jgi:hypothetical protein